VEGNIHRWLSMAFAAIVSEAVPMSSLLHLPDSLQQMRPRFPAYGIDQHSVAGIFALTVGFFEVTDAAVFLAAFVAYLGAARSFRLLGFLSGLPTGLLVLALGDLAVMSLLVFSPVQIPHIIYFYVLLRLPVFFSLALALGVALCSRITLRRIACSTGATQRKLTA
jgi:hypothetical protein